MVSQVSECPTQERGTFTVAVVSDDFADPSRIQANVRVEPLTLLHVTESTNRGVPLIVADPATTTVAG